MTDTELIYVGLLDEGVDVCRFEPVLAEHLGGNVYRILGQTPDRETESWQFELGDEVICELIEASEGTILAATRTARWRDRSRQRSEPRAPEGMRGPPKSTLLYPVFHGRI